MQTADLLDRMIAQEKEARDFGFYWENVDQLLDQIRSECDEIKEALHHKERPHLQEEIGDLMNAAVSLCIFCDMDPLQTMQESADKFQKRYDSLVSMAKQDGHTSLKNQKLSFLLSYWDKAKKAVG